MSSSMRRVYIHSAALLRPSLSAGVPAVAAQRPATFLAPQRISSSSSSSLLTSFPSQPRIFSRAYSLGGNEVKSGATIKHEGRTYLCIGTSVNMKGRAHTTYNLDLKDVANGSKITIKVRPADKIEVIEMQTIRMNFLYRQGKQLIFMDPVTFEQIEVDVSLGVNNSAMYLVENSSVGLVRDGENIVKIVVPEKLVATVESTSPARTKVNDQSGKEAKLTNGLTIMVPPHIEVGQHILVNTQTDGFVQKSEQPPEPIVETVHN